MRILVKFWEQLEFMIIKRYKGNWFTIVIEFDYKYNSIMLSMVWIHSKNYSEYNSQELFWDIPVHGIDTECEYQGYCIFSRFCAYKLIDK